MAQLISLDTNEEFQLPEGETRIGRGPFLKVTDKKVSRNHAIVLKDSNGISVKPIHNNPTFLFDAKTNKWKSLPKDEWTELEDGDKITLLPNTLIFRLELLKEDKEEKAREEIAAEEKTYAQKKESLQVEIENSKQNNKDVNTTTSATESTLTTTAPKILPVEIASNSNVAVKRTTKSTSSSVEWQPNSKSKTKRKLPTWMMNLEQSSVATKTESKKVTAGRKRKASKPTNQTGNQLNDIDEDDSGGNLKFARTNKNERGGGSKAENITESLIRDKSPRTQEEQLEGKSTETLRNAGLMKNANNTVVTKSITDSRREASPASKATPEKTNKNDLLDELMDLPNQTSSTTATSPPSSNKNQEKDDSVLSQLMNSSDVERKKGPVENDEETRDGEEGTKENPFKSQSTENQVSNSPPKQKKNPNNLPLCPYGSHCYRKNPVHFNEYFHDKGTEDDNEDADKGDDRPECQYGTSCYRKNPQHRKEYKHTKDVTQSSTSPIKRTRRTRTRATKGKSVLTNESDDDGEANDYDYNDSFIDDYDDEDKESYEDPDDSDFVPDKDEMAGDSQDDEDLSELVNEAKDFIGNKKMQK